MIPRRHTSHRRHMSCAEFSARMAELIASGKDILAHPHVRQCKLHRALLSDLEAIASAAREMFPDVDPPDLVWDGIQARLAREDCPDPIVSDPWPGCRVVVAAQVIETFNSEASPPPLDLPFGEEKSSGGSLIFGAIRTLPRREGGR
jgi:hypothetical protein